jgi:hypothetical protein
MFTHLIFITVYVLLFALDVPETLQYALIAHIVSMLYSYVKQKKMPDPLLIYILYVGLVNVSNLAVITALEEGALTSYYSYIVPENVNIASMIWCIGNTLIFIGYDFFSKFSLSPVNIDLKDPKKLNQIFILMLVLSFKPLYLNELKLGSIGVVLGIFANMGLIFFARLGAAYNITRYQRYALTLFIIQTIIAVLYSFLRTEMLLPTLCFAIGYLLGKRSLKDVFSYKAIPFIAMLFLFNAYFDSFGNHRTNLSVGFQRLTELDMISRQETYYEDVEKQSVLFRSSVLPQLTSLVGLVETKGFYNGAAISPLFIALIPRFLWPEKPLIGLGAWFATEIGQGRATDTWFSNSINMTIPGHLYLDFGWIGVILGCLFMGGFLVILWNSSRFYDSPYNITGIIFGSYLMVSGFTGIGADLQIIISLLSYYLLFLLIKKIF